jgi:hypothetical protein
MIIIRNNRNIKQNKMNTIVMLYSSDLVDEELSGL